MKQSPFMHMHRPGLRTLSVYVVMAPGRVDLGSVDVTARPVQAGGGCCAAARPSARPATRAEAAIFIFGLSDASA